MPEPKIFRADVYGECMELDNYLSALSIDGRTFNCDKLRVLPEPIKIIFQNKPSENYPQGSLICLWGVENMVRKRCAVNSELDLKEGKLVFKCASPDRHEFTAELCCFK